MSDDDFWDCPTCNREMPPEHDYECGCCGSRASHHISVTSMCKIMRAALDREASLKVEVGSIERERDEWKRKYIQQNKDLGCEMKDPNGTIWDHAKRLQEELENLKASTIHTCHDQCQRPMCVTRRERDRLADALREITTYDPSDGQCNSGYSCKYIAEQALSAVKGGQP